MAYNGSYSIIVKVCLPFLNLKQVRCKYPCNSIILASLKILFFSCGFGSTLYKFKLDNKTMIQ